MKKRHPASGPVKGILLTQTRPLTASFSKGASIITREISLFLFP